MQLTVLKQTSKQVTYGWTPPVGVYGNVYLRDGVRISSDWNALKKTVTFNIPDNKQHTFEVRPLGGLDSGVAVVNGPPPVPNNGNGSLYGPFLKADSFWRKGVPLNPIWDTSSQIYVDELTKACPGGFYTNGWEQNGANSVPFYYATESTPKRTVALAIAYKGKNSIDIPYLSTYAAAAPGDNHLDVILPDGTIYEFQGFTVSSHDGSLSAHSVAMGNVINGYGIATSTDRISITPTYAGTMLASEIHAGYIPHTLRAAIPVEGMSNSFRPPANYDDGNLANGWPGGLWACLPRDVDISGYDPYQTMGLQALKDFGLINADSNGQSPVVSLFAEAICDGCSYSFPLTSIPAKFIPLLKILAIGQ